MQPGCKLPAKIGSISDPGVHAIAARRDVLVRRIAGKKHPANSVTPGDQEMRRPGTREQDFVIEDMTGEITEHCASTIFSGAMSRGNRAWSVQMSRSFCAIKVPLGDFRAVDDGIAQRSAALDDPPHMARI